MNELIKKVIERTAQDVSYRLGDLIKNYPPTALPLVVGVIRAVTDALIDQMTDQEKQVVKCLKEDSEIIVLPSAFDPRKQEKQK